MKEDSIKVIKMISKLFAEYLKAYKNAGGVLSLAQEIALRETESN